MKIRTDLSAGMTYQECDQARNYWKDMAQRGYSNISPPSTGGTVTTAAPQPVYYPQQPVYYPQQPHSPTYPTSGTQGAYYPDRSGYCG
ncbi:MAG: hypothetical protein MUO67_20325 [Anaerolineales bacterium]|nr:hypothetical protein [Anaerolineales bacterium]